MLEPGERCGRLAKELAETVVGLITCEFGTGKLIWPTRAEIIHAVHLANEYIRTHESAHGTGEAAADSDKGE